METNYLRTNYLDEEPHAQEEEEITLDKLKEENYYKYHENV